MQFSPALTPVLLKYSICRAFLTVGRKAYETQGNWYLIRPSVLTTVAHLVMQNRHFAVLMHRSQGFTLVELMIAIAVLGILLALAVPSFQGLIASSRLTAATNDMVSALAQARSNAIKTGNRITLCPSSNGTSCASSGTWEQGWISFIDTDRTGTSAAVDTGETVLTSNQAMPTGIIINGNLTYVSFSADGMPKTLTGGIGAGTMRVCNTSGALSNDNRTRDLVMNSVGRISITKTTGVAATCPTIS